MLREPATITLEQDSVLPHLESLGSPNSFITVKLLSLIPRDPV